MTAEPLDPYTESCRDAIKSSSAKLGKTFENPLLRILLLYTVIQRKINSHRWSVMVPLRAEIHNEFQSQPGYVYQLG